MNEIKKMNVDQLRSVLEEAFQTIGKEKVPTNELKELIGSSFTKQEWGGLIVRLTANKILAKDIAPQLKIGKQRFNYYRLVPNVAEVGNPQAKKEDTYFIFNETTKESEIISGEIELNKKINSLLKGTDYELRIFKEVSRAKNAPKIESV